MGKLKRSHSVDVDTTSRSSTTSPSTPRSFLCGKRVKCSHTSRTLKTNSKRKPVSMSSAFSWTEETITSRMNLQPIFERKEFDENLPADTQQNGVAKRKHRHILEVARASMNEKNLPNLNWTEAVNTIVYLINWCTSSRVHDVTPTIYPMGGYSTRLPMYIFPKRSSRSSILSQTNVSL